MARWRLSTSHYLSVENNEWEYNETDRASGKQLRTRIKVPLYLHIDDPNCWNVTYRNPRGEVVAGEIIVAQESGAHEKSDILFLGEPTPDMIPIDDEATAISKTFEKKWNAKPDAEVSYGQKLVEQYEAMSAEVRSRENTVKIEGMAEIMKTMTDMMAQNQSMMAQLLTKGTIERRV